MTRRMFRRGPASVLLIVSVAAAVVVLVSAAPTMAAPQGVCVAARVTASFRLPDGVLHPAGTLTVCDTREYSPVADLHVILVDGHRIGMFVSRKRTTEAGPGISPELVFARDLEGHLDLMGYILPALGGSVAYRLRGRGDGWSAREGLVRANGQGVGAAVTLASTRIR